MKVLRFIRNLNGISFQKKVKFWPKNGPFMSWKKIPFFYFRRLFKELVLIFAVFFFCLLIINLAFPKSPFEKAKENILINSTDKKSHQELSQYFYSVNDFDAAELEMKLVFDNPNAWELLKIKEMKDEPERIKDEIVLWQKASEELPYFRDAYIKLAILSQKIYRDFDARKFLQKALEIDHNNETALGIFKYLK